MRIRLQAGLLIQLNGDGILCPEKSTSNSRRNIEVFDLKRGLADSLEMADAFHGHTIIKARIDALRIEGSSFEDEFSGVLCARPS